MSREFGEYIGGFFHQKIANAAQDAVGGSAQITRLWGRLLQEIEPVAYSISTSEACDSAEYDPIMTSMAKMEIIQRRLDEIKEYLKPFHDVAEEAVRLKAMKQ